MVLFKEGDTEEEATSGLYKDLLEAKSKFTDIGQVCMTRKNIFSFKGLEKEYGIKHAQATKAE
eukprot:8526114-Heterocapsa_arctica.AAC.1